MAKVPVSVVHKLTGEIVAISHSQASVNGETLHGVAIGGPDESVITTEIEESELASMLTTHIVVDQSLRARDA